MRKPVYPCKVGLYLKTNLNDYDHYVGHILDVDTRPRQSIPEEEPYVEYEIPIMMMVHDSIENDLIKNSTDDDFDCRGITFSVETSVLPGKDNTSKAQPEELDLETIIKLAKEKQSLTIQIKKIDMIFNPEYERLSKVYKLPVFFKSLSGRHLKYYDQGFIDNGRRKVPLLT